MDEIRNDLSRVEMEVEICEAELAEMIQKRERAKEEIRKKKSKAEKIRVHKLIVFAAAFFSNFRESSKNKILDFPDTELEKIAKEVFRVYQQSVKSLRKK